MSRLSYIAMDSPNSQQWYKNCCFCIPLRIGTLIMVYLALVYTAVATVAVSGSFVWVWMETSGIREREKPSSRFTVSFQRLILEHYAAILSFLTLFHVFALILAIICLVGIHKRQPDLIHWHISFTFARILIMIAALGYNYYLALETIITIIHLLDIGLSVFYLTVLFIYTAQLKKELSMEKEINIIKKKEEEILKVNSNKKHGAVF